MKKLVLMFVAFAAISFASCNDQKKVEAPVEEPAVEVVDTTAAADTTAAPADTTAAPADSVK
ncbi:MAG: hypothetical protein K5893_11875 [Prevotella sp.]|nr:hypothetical protein [Prevotella sp.]